VSASDYRPIPAHMPTRTLLVLVAETVEGVRESAPTDRDLLDHRAVASVAVDMIDVPLSPEELDAVEALALAYSSLLGAVAL
jgi:hypothetical protein